MELSGDLDLFNAALRGIAPRRAEGARANPGAGKTFLAGQAEETPLQKNLRQMRDNLERLRAAASPGRQTASRVGWLKRRLEIMLGSLQFATPEQAKVMVRELKKIAKELAAAAESLDGGEGTAGLGKVQAIAGRIAVTEADAAADGAAAQAAEVARQTEAKADQAARQADAEARTAENEAASAAARAAETETPDGREAGEARSVSAAGVSGAEDKSLRMQLEETGKLLKRVLALLKTKLTDKEGRKDAEAAEASLVQMEQALSPSSFYDALGAPAPVAASAGGVDVSA
jgi:hypothetical protein